MMRAKIEKIRGYFMDISQKVSHDQDTSEQMKVLLSCLVRIERAVAHQYLEPDLKEAERLLKLARLELLDIQDLSYGHLSHYARKGLEGVDMLTGVLDEMDENTSPETHNKADSKIRAYVLSKTNGQCVYCDAELNQHDMHVDHIVPVVAGGPDHLTNYVPSCPSCNMSKSAHDPVLFVKKMRNNISFLKVVGDE